MFPSTAPDGGPRHSASMLGGRCAAPLTAIDDLTITDQGDALTVRATKTIDTADPHLTAHFPQFSIFPGAFIVESLRQAVAAALGDAGTGLLHITAIRSVRFLAPLFPGDRMQLVARITPAADGTFDVTAQALRDDGTVASRLKVAFGPVAGDRPPDYARLRTLLPHAHPMLLIDRVVALDPGQTITAIKAVTGTEPCFRALAADIPPDGYAYPTSLMLESFGQAAAILWLGSPGARARGADEIVVLAAVRNCRIEGHAYPGDVLRHVARLDRVVGDTVIVEGETWIGDRRVAVVESMIAAVRSGAAMGEAMPERKHTPDRAGRV